MGKGPLFKNVFIKELYLFGAPHDIFGPKTRIFTKNDRILQIAIDSTGQYM